MTTRVAEKFRDVARRRAAGGYAPVYARLAEACADDPLALELADHARPGQNPPSLLLGAVQYVLAGEPDDALARFYPAVSGRPAPDPDADDPSADLSAFVRRHRDSIGHLVAERLVQTHEVGRCAYLYPALIAAQEHAGGPLAAVEVGASAGLTLVPDRYAYDYDTGRLYGDPDSPLVLPCELRGPLHPPLGAPLDISWRAGLDLNPLDLADEGDRAWLRALVWPDHPERAARLDAALEAARRGPPPPIHRGGAHETVGHVLDQAPPEATAVVFHTAVAAHFTEEARTAWRRRLLELSAHKRILWLRAEPHEQPKLRFSDLRDGAVRAEVPLGGYHPHGTWLDWSGA